MRSPFIIIKFIHLVLVVTNFSLRETTRIALSASYLKQNKIQCNKQRACFKIYFLCCITLYVKKIT